MKKYLLPLLAILTLFLSRPYVCAKEKSKDLPPPPIEQTHKLDTMEVKTNPFADWGISIHWRGSLWTKIGGGPAKVMYVSLVVGRSPAEKAGVQLGDEIVAVNGIPRSELNVRDLKKQFYNTERGEKVSLELRDQASGLSRIVELDVKSNKTWRAADGSVDLCFWGLRVAGPDLRNWSFVFDPNMRRVLGWKTVQVVDKRKPKNSEVKNKQKPIYIHRRTAIFTSGEKGFVLIERENRVVEIIDAAKAPESDDVVGRLVGEGSTLTLKTDGTYELNAIEPKAEPVKMPPVGSEIRTADQVVEAKPEQSSVSGPTPAVAQWNRSVEPFCIAGNLYYVGASGVAAYLITTPEGHILIDSGFSETVSHIEANMKKLGYRFEDIRILLISHGHYDHVGGMAELKERTKARLLANPVEGDLLRHGGKGDFAFKDQYTYAPVSPDGELRDGEIVKLGGVGLTAHFTPGHTKGCTSWTMTVNDNGREYRVVIAASMSAPGYQLVGNPDYPDIVADYKASFAKLRALPCDIFLSLHGWDFGLSEKLAAWAKNRTVNPFVAPEGYRRFLDKSETSLQAQIEKQLAGDPKKN